MCWYFHLSVGIEYCIVVYLKSQEGKEEDGGEEELSPVGERNLILK